MPRANVGSGNLSFLTPRQFAHAFGEMLDSVIDAIQDKTLTHSECKRMIHALEKEPMRILAVKKPEGDTIVGDIMRMVKEAYPEKQVDADNGALVAEKVLSSRMTVVRVGRRRKAVPTYYDVYIEMEEKEGMDSGSDKSYWTLRVAMMTKF